MHYICIYECVYICVNVGKFYTLDEHMVHVHSKKNIINIYESYELACSFVSDFFVKET